MEAGCVVTSKIRTEVTPTVPPGIQNKTTDAVPQHFNQKGHKLADVELVPLELVNSKRETIRGARETLYMEMAKTMQPHGINSDDDR